MNEIITILTIVTIGCAVLNVAAACVSLYFLIIIIKSNRRIEKLQDELNKINTFHLDPK